MPAQSRRAASDCAQLSPLTKQSGRVADAMQIAFEARACGAIKVLIEFTDER